jgi:hypothetical protein
MRLKRISGAFCVLLFLSLLHVHAAAEQTGVGNTLTGPEIENTLSNSATKGINEFGNPYTVWFLAGGRLDGVAGKEDEFVDAGEWWIEENYLCRRWNVWLDGAIGCFQVVINDDTIYWLNHLDQVVTVEEFHGSQ